jgi:GAF domain-containing protein
MLKRKLPLWLALFALLAAAPAAARAAEEIRRAGGYRWVGIYTVLEREIAVVAWSGPGAPTHPRFPRERGLNGAAVRTGEPIVVQDVAADPRYLPTLGGTRAEAIVPVRSPSSGAVVGTIDVESDRVGAFTDADRALLASELDPHGITSTGVDWKKLVAGKKLWNFSKHEYDAWRGAL